MIIAIAPTKIAALPRAKTIAYPIHNSQYRLTYRKMKEIRTTDPSVR